MHAAHAALTCSYVPVIINCASLLQEIPHKLEQQLAPWTILNMVTGDQDVMIPNAHYIARAGLKNALKIMPD